MAHGQRKTPLDFGGNPDHVTLGLGLGFIGIYGLFYPAFCYQ